jgi:hypothetical protein
MIVTVGVNMRESLDPFISARPSNAAAPIFGFGSSSCDTTIPREPYRRHRC